MEKCFLKKDLLLPIIFILLRNMSAFPQNNRDVYSSTRLNLNIVINKSTDELNRLWNAQKGFEGSIEWPFYYGTVVGGVRFLPYKAEGNIHHDVASVFYFAGWGKEMNLPLTLSWYGGFKVGAFEMFYDGDSLTEEQHHKLQLSAGVTSRMSIEIIHHCFTYFSADYAAVFTHKRIELFLLSAGISYSFATPVWLKDFLK